MSKNNKTPRERIPASHTVCVIALTLQMLGGVGMTLPFFKGIGHGLLAGVLLVLLFMWLIGRESRGVRVTARVLMGLVYAFAGILLLPALAGSYSAAELQEEFLPNFLCTCLPVLLWLSPAVGVMALRRGRYDRFVACFSQVWLAVALGLSLSRDGMPWLLDISALRFILCALTAFATVTVWLCAVRRPRQVAAVEGTTLHLEETDP